MKRTNEIMVRLSDEESARLDELRGNQSRAVFMRQMLREPPRDDDIATRGEALALLSNLARGGSVAATIALARELRDHGFEDSGELARWLRGE